MIDKSGRETEEREREREKREQRSTWKVKHPSCAAAAAKKCLKFHMHKIAVTPCENEHGPNMNTSESPGSTNLKNAATLDHILTCRCTVSSGGGMASRGDAIAAVGGGGAR
jgi:hypothetical protein